MTRHYSTRDFFRNTPNALLSCYFKARGVLQDFDFTAIKETKIDALFEAWLALPDAQRASMDTELREVSEMSSDKGTKAIIDEAEFHLSEDGAHEAFVAKLMALPGHHERAMTTFLDHATLWKGATRFYHADTLSHWRKRKNLPQVKAAIDQASLDALAAAIGRYFRQAEGRGMHCVVEPYRRGELDYFFAYPEDYAQQAVEWVGDEFERRPHHPAFEIVFVYAQQGGRLDLHLTGDRKAVEPLQAIFAETILKCDELPADPTDTRVYNLFSLRRKDFSFTWNPASGVERVAVNKLRLSLNKDKKLTLEANPKHDAKAVYALLDKLAPVLPSHEYQISQVGITATVKLDPKAPAKTVTFQVTYPNSCSLKYDEIGLKLRAMLEASGIEPKEPAEGAAATDPAVPPAPTL